MDTACLPDRVHIIAAGGSGKTTFARRLSSQLNVPCYHLDHVAFGGDVGRKRDLAERLMSVRTIIA